MKLINPNATVADELARLASMRDTLRDAVHECKCPTDKCGTRCDRCEKYERAVEAHYRLSEMMEVEVADE